MTEASQRARAAAADLFADMGGTKTGCSMIRQGEADDAPVVRHFARFEAETLANATPTAEAGLREALQTALFHIGHHSTCALGPLHNCSCGIDEVLQEIRTTLKGSRGWES